LVGCLSIIAKRLSGKPGYDRIWGAAQCQGRHAVIATQGLRWLTPASVKKVRSRATSSSIVIALPDDANKRLNTLLRVFTCEVTQTFAVC